MGKSNIEQLAIAKKYLGQGGSHFRKYCGLPAGSAWCDAYVTTIFHEAGNASLFCDGKKQTYCPTTIKWCYNNLASIPPYLALPSDIIFFDWELNGIPNHIGFVRERKSCDEIYTIEGNTGNSICANRTRNTKYVQAVFRPHFKPTAFDVNKELVIDGLMGYHTIARLQKALGVEVDGILGKGTVRALQKRAGTTQDGHWGNGTSRAVQKMLGVKADGLFGPDSVKALQKWCNDKVFGGDVKPTPSVKTQGDKIADSAKSYIGKVKYVKGGTSLKTGADCTGFVQAIHKLHGITLDVRKSWGKSVGKDISKAKRGDVIYYYKNGKLHHMGIYDGNGKIVHCSTSHKDWHKDCCVDNAKLPGFKIGDIRRCWK